MENLRRLSNSLPAIITTNTTQMSALKALLESTSVDSLPTPKGKVIVIDSQSTLIKGFETLLDNGILSAPVYDSAAKTYTGFLDIRDLVSFVVFVHDEQKVTDTNTLKDIITHGSKLFTTPTTDGVTISYLSRRNKFVPVQQGSPLSQAFEIIATRGVHRVPVVDGHGQVVNIISQSSIINFLSTHLKQLGELTEVKIGEAHLGSRPVISVNKDAVVIEAFRVMDTSRRSGVALADNNGRLVGTTTGKDLGLFIRNPTLPALDHVSIFKFLADIRAQQIDIKSPTIAVFERDTVGKAIGLLAATKVHRVFVVDNEHDYKPVAVISIADVLNYMMLGKK